LPRLLDDEQSVREPNIEVNAQQPPPIGGSKMLHDNIFQNRIASR